MLHHTRPQSHLAAHRGMGKSNLTHLLTASVTRRKLLGDKTSPLDAHDVEER